VEVPVEGLLPEVRFRFAFGWIGAQVDLLPKLDTRLFRANKFVTEHMPIKLVRLFEFSGPVLWARQGRALRRIPHWSSSDYIRPLVTQGNELEQARLLVVKDFLL
tara:strand:- start:560 stop:874 length:315 start_codon:yes stop_codon:yes gene_type:complete